MSVVLDRPAVPAEAASVRTLAVIEAKRFARHPVFLVGIALCTFALVMVSDDHGDRMADGFFGSFLIGIFGMVVAYRLTRSTERSGEAVDSSPVSEVKRTAALCLACLVPATAGLVALLVIGLYSKVSPAPEFTYATLSTFERVTYYFGQTVVASLGGPLLGVAAARWLRFPGAVVVLVVVVIGQVIAVEGIADPLIGHDSRAWTALRVFAPWAWFHTSEMRDGESIATVRFGGSVSWFLVWQVALCALAACAALLHGASGRIRLRILQVFAIAFLCAVTAYVLTVLGGPDSLVRVTQP